MTCKGDLDHLLDVVEWVIAMQEKSILQYATPSIQIVSQERDSYKGILDSYQHELTITGSKFAQDQISVLTKVLEDHKAIVEDLEEQLLAAKSAGGESSLKKSAAVNSAEVSKLRSDLKSLQDRLTKAENEREDLRYELDRRAMKGDYNPLDTKVLHFK